MICFKITSKIYVRSLIIFALDCRFGEQGILPGGPIKESAPQTGKFVLHGQDLGHKIFRAARPGAQKFKKFLQVRKIFA